jgi:CBS domain-containing protein
MTGSIPARYCTIYQGRGQTAAHHLPANLCRDPARTSTRADNTELGEIMCRDLICVRPDLEIEAVIGLIVDKHLGCLPVVDEHRRPIGMITKFDIVEHLNAYVRSVANGEPLPIDIAARSADEVMMPIALTLDESATVGDAASMMTCEDLHHVLVVSRGGALVGVVSTKDIVTWLVRNDGLMPFRDDPPG